MKSLKGIETFICVRVFDFLFCLPSFEITDVSYSELMYYTLDDLVRLTFITIAWKIFVSFLKKLRKNLWAAHANKIFNNTFNLLFTIFVSSVVKNWI